MIQIVKLKGAQWVLQEYPICKPRTQMQTLTKMDKVVIEDYYHMITMNENVN
jgi:hypothetical protein